MQLIYVYLHCCRDEKYDLGINISNEFFVEYAVGNDAIKIEKTKNKIEENFFGHNISNVTALIGRNGAGKTTLLDAIGLKRLDSNDFHRVNNASWFCVYHIKDDDFAIEGAGQEIFFPRLQNSKKGFFAYIFKLSEGYLSYSEFLQDYPGSFKKNSAVLYNPKIKVRNRFKQEYDNYGIRREYINISYKSMYDLLCDNDFIPKKENINFSLKVPLSFSNSKISNEEKLCLFEDGDFYTSFIYDVRFDISKKVHRRLGDDCKVVIKNEKELYITHLIETVINEYFLCAVYDHSPMNINDHLLKENVDYFLKKINKKNLGDMKGYKELNRYLNNIMLDFKKESESLIGIEETRDWLAVIQCLESFPLKWFSRKERCFVVSIPCNEKSIPYKDKIYALLDEFDKSCFVKSESISLEQPQLSSGQTSLLNKIAGIYTGIKNQINEKNEEASNIFLLLDEYEEHLHPEWARQFFFYLVEMIESLENINVQIILSTHNPYIVSDLPKENIIKILYEGGARKINTCNFGFGSNLYDVICDNFFLENTMGVFSSRKINNMIGCLESNNDLECSDVERFQYIINIIDDDYIKCSLQNLLDEKMPLGMIENKIKKLEERISVLKCVKQGVHK